MLVSQAKIRCKLSCSREGESRCVSGVFWAVSPLVSSFSRPLACRQLVAPYDTIYVFGDSLTDIGNFLAVTSSGALPDVPPQPLPPHYVTGRRSNGPIWIDYLAADLGLRIRPSLTGGTDFAYAGGAETGNNPLHRANSWTSRVPRANWRSSSKRSPIRAGMRFSTFWMGGNDLYGIFDALGAGGSPDATAVVQCARRQRRSFVQTIAGLGARTFSSSPYRIFGKTPEITQNYPSFAAEASQIPRSITIRNWWPP